MPIFEMNVKCYVSQKVQNENRVVLFIDENKMLFYVCLMLPTESYSCDLYIFKSQKQSDNLLKKFKQMIHKKHIPITPKGSLCDTLDEIQAK